MNNILNKVKVIIIDDELSFVSSLEIIINANFPEFEIVGKGYSMKQGVDLILQLSPDLVFLDVNLPDGNGFDVLNETKSVSFEVIFASAFSEYAFLAFEFSALHYITKPLQLDKLKDAIDRFSKKITLTDFDSKIQVLKEGLEAKPKRIVLPTLDGQNIFYIEDIVKCESDNHYITIYFSDNKKVHILYSLQKLISILLNYDFVRIHNQYLVNMNYIQRVDIGLNSFVTMKDNVKLPISRNSKNEFQRKFSNFLENN
jgi:two-component system LytT family response regulator